MRVRTLAGILVAAASAVGCGSSTDDTTTPGQQQVEIFSWWTSGGESDGLKALTDLYSAKYPDVQLINSAVTGGAGTNARDTLATRLQHGNPPDAFQAHGGAELTDSWIKINGDDSQNVMEPLDFLYDAEGWRSAYPADILDIPTYKGSLYSVLVDIHRGNVVFYNKKLFTTNGIEEPKATWTWADFYTAAEAIKAKLPTVAPLAVGAKDIWAASMIFDNILLAKGGADYYKSFYQGAASPNDAQVMAAATEMVKLMGYVEPNPGQYGWDAATDLVINGDAAMTIMGDWAKGYMTSKMLAGGVDFDAVPAPDTGTAFVVVTDTFGLPKGAPHRDNAINLLRIFGSKEGQDAFNPIKGSIPPRTDADLTKYDAMSQQTIKDFAVTAHVPSMAHGSAADPAFVNDFNSAMSTFVDAPDANALVGSLNTIYARLK